MSTHLFLGTSTSSLTLAPHAAYLTTQQKEMMEDLEYKQRYLSITFREWIRYADTLGIDVTQQRHKMENVLRIRPDEMNHFHQQEVWFLYETTMLNIITTQVVRKIAETCIRKTAQAGRAMPQLKNQIDVINKHERDLLKALPGELPRIVDVETAIKKYQLIMHELASLKEKMLSKASKVRD